MRVDPKANKALRPSASSPSESPESEPLLKYKLTDTGENAKLLHRRKRPKKDTLFSSLFFRRVRGSDSERRVWLSDESKILASTFGRFRVYRFVNWLIKIFLSDMKILGENRISLYFSGSLVPKMRQKVYPCSTWLKKRTPSKLNLWITKYPWWGLLEPVLRGRRDQAGCGKQSSEVFDKRK